MAGDVAPVAAGSDGVEAGVAGCILPDLPLEESAPWCRAADHEGVETVMLALVATTAGLFIAVPLSFLAARNLPNVGICDVASMDPVVLIRFEKVLVTLPALKLIEERLS